MAMHRCLLILAIFSQLVSCSSFAKFQSFSHVPLTNRTASSLNISTNHTLTFAEISSAAMNHHPDVEVAKSEANIAKAAVQSADVKPNPTLGFTPTRAIPKEAGISPWLMGFTFDIPIETNHKRQHRTQQAIQTANAAALRVSDAAWLVRSSLRKNWLDLFSAKSRKALLQNQLITSQSVVNTLEARVKNGESSQTELLQARLMFNQSTLAMNTAQRAEDEAVSDLASTFNLPKDKIKNAQFDFSHLENPAANVSEEKLKHNALTQRSDILASLSEYAATESALRLEVAKQFPDIHLSPGYEYDQGVNKWSLGFNLTLPMFDQNKGGIAEAKAKRESQAAKFYALQSKVGGDLNHALASYHGALNQWHTTQNMVSQSHKQIASAETLRKGGEEDSLAVLNAQVEYQVSQLAEHDALLEVLRALASLEDAAQFSLIP